MARKKKTTPEKTPAVIVKAHSYVEVRYPKAVERSGGVSHRWQEDFVKLLPREEAIEFARAIEEAAKEVL